MVVSLGKGRTMSREPFPAQFIGFKNTLVSIRVVTLQPSKEGGTEVKAYFRVIIDDGYYSSFSIEEAGLGIRRIAL